MSNIIIEDAIQTTQKGGIGQFTITIENALNQENIKFLNFKKPFLLKLKNKYIRRFFYNLWLNTYFLIKLLLIKGEKQVIFTNFSVPIFKIPNTEYISAIHDIRCIDDFKSYSKFINWYEKNNLLNAIKNANKIITVSNTMKNDIISHFPQTSNKIYVVYNSLGKHFEANTDVNIEKIYNITPKKYILSVATLAKRKRIPLLIEAFEKISAKYPDLKLVLVGKMDNDKQLSLTKNPNIIFTGYIEDKMIPYLYKNALLYVFPSEYEGFGIPIIEAQYSNIPILCSNIEVFKEIAGNGAEYCELNSNEMAEKIEYLINSPDKINELINEGTQNVKRFSINKIVEQLKVVVGE